MFILMSVDYFFDWWIGRMSPRNVQKLRECLLQFVKGRVYDFKCLALFDQL